MVKILEQASLFDNMKFCAICHRSLPENYEEEMCPACQENQLFSEVKEYILSGEKSKMRFLEKDGSGSDD